MAIEIIPAGEPYESILRHLYQFYMYEFSRITGWGPNLAGLFGEDDLDGCWTRPHIHPFLVAVDENWSGFALVTTMEHSHLTHTANAVDMSEFFIMGYQQKKGVGEYVATQLFDMFPGKWEVYQLTQNVNAQAFWRKVIGRYTNGQYQEFPHYERGVYQTFDTGLPD
jgi:predicted acetyltransferase